MNSTTKTKPNIKKLFDKAEMKNKDMFRCLYDVSSPLGILVLDQHKKCPETGRFSYHSEEGKNNIHIPDFRFQGSHN